MAELRLKLPRPTDGSCYIRGCEKPGLQKAEYQTASIGDVVNQAMLPPSDETRGVVYLCEAHMQEVRGFLKSDPQFPWPVFWEVN